jgi:acetyl-CoA carboxylase biotin carboxylase subunit
LKGFLPSPGEVETLRVPSGPGVRDDSGIAQGYRVTPHYDPLLSKLCVWAPTREQAIRRMTRALDEYRVQGLATNLGFHRRVMLEPDFLAGNYDTGYIEAHQATLCSPDTLSASDARDVALALAAIRASQDLAAGRERTAQASTVTANALPAWVLADRRGD